MLGMIDDFVFKMNETQFSSISHEIDFDWSESKRIGNHPKFQAVGKSSESFSISGTLIFKRIDSFDALISIANKKKPVVLSYANAISITVTIKNIKRELNTFIKTGEFLEQAFTIELKRWYP